MPSTSPKQHRFMEMVDHNPAAAKRVGVPVSVGREFVTADQAPSHRRKTSFAGRRGPGKPKL
jgi:hypothetical protein